MTAQESRIKNREGGARSGDNFHQHLATGLGWFSLGLGLAELLAPAHLADLIGLGEDKWRDLILRSYGAREIGAGLSIFLQSRSAESLWARVAGDVVDLASLGWALTRPDADRTKLAISTGAVAGFTALDILCAQGLSRGSGSRITGPVRVAKTVIINRSSEDLYQFWREPANLAALTDSVEAVKQSEETRSHWILRIPGGRHIEWDSELTDIQPNSRLAWQTVPGSMAKHSGSVQFERATGGRGTLVRVELEYDLPGGAKTANIAKLLGMEPGQQIENALRRFKQIMETGEITRSDASIHAGMHAAQPPAEAPAQQMSAAAGA